jgi:UDP-N-acetylglucosamine--N-acetylmuramyl-(pentapeptide) pyrophosphoryl-undecaprenol N-acetylglucosamine transferase
MVRDNEIDEKLFSTAFEVVNDLDKCENLSAKIKTLAKPEATKTIVDEVEKIIV